MILDKNAVKDVTSPAACAGPGEQGHALRGPVREAGGRRGRAAGAAAVAAAGARARRAADGRVGGGHDRRDQHELHRDPDVREPGGLRHRARHRDHHHGAPPATAACAQLCGLQAQTAVAHGHRAASCADQLCLGPGLLRLAAAYGASRMSLFCSHDFLKSWLQSQKDLAASYLLSVGFLMIVGFAVEYLLSDRC